MPVQNQGVFLRVTKRQGPRLPPPAIQAADLLEAFTSPAAMDRQEPQAPKPRAMIETMRIVGEDRLTASDGAVYEMLLAWAREQGLHLETHEIPFAVIRSYLEVPSIKADKRKKGETRTVRTDDLVAGLHRLSSTLVRYDVRDEEFRRRGTVPLVLAEVRESLRDGTATVSYTIPPHIRRLMLEARSYGRLELRAFPRFRCRYTARLYQRLALRAGYDRELIKPWEIEPQKLAEEIGYRWSGAFRFVDFRRYCLDPMRWDMEEHVQRFSVRVEEVPVQGSGRGRPRIGLLRFYITPEERKLATLVAGSMSAVEVAEVNKADPRLAPAQLPSAGAVARTVLHLENRHFSAFLSNAWRAAVVEALDGVLRGDAKAPVEGDLHGAELLRVLANVGADECFFAWAQRTDRTGRFLRSIDAPAPESATAPTPPVSREERRRERARNDAAQILAELKKDFTETFFQIWRAAWCDAEQAIWTWPSERLPDEGSGLRHALRAIPQMSIERSRQTLYNLANAVLADDVEKVGEIAVAVAAATYAAERAESQTTAR
ncbi:RepB family plasmid replication initiator protein [Microvirga splendida]|uniref:Replication initiation protein n=1 Tax=Microvirga splendida TaxID=2795727 RepID=A0ABS0XZF1_9HYPH|nr:RepB family plasmid replication initiator protein [Microvirga splendida]MBJ6125422.1 replication initiation protein [Microvirga splendida]